jgi:hypothetical protein
MTSDPDGLGALVTTLTAGTVVRERELAAALGRAAEDEPAPLGRRPGWTAWEIDVLRRVVWPERWAAHASLGDSRPSFIHPR